MINKKKNRGRKYVPRKCENRKSIFPTANSKMIYDLMKDNNVRGKYKDYVIIVESRIVDWLDTYEIVITNEEGIKSYGMNGIALIHKRKLCNILGKEVAKKFWNHGVRTNFGVDKRRAGCYVKDVNSRV